MTTTPTQQMKRTWLVQRLKRPLRDAGTIHNAFAFGGGLRNGGLSGDAMGLLRDIFRFDYMGSAEFEWGAVPDALSGLAKDRKQLVGFSLTVPLKFVPPNWRIKNDTPPDGDATIYVLCRKQHRGEVQARIILWASGHEELKERTDLPASLRPYHDWDGETCGWLELNNGFFFFTDEAMWRSATALFGTGAQS